MEKNETYMNNKFIYGNDYFRRFNNLNQFDFSKAQIMEPLGPALDIFGDGSLWAVSYPGNKESHVSYLINAEQGPVLIIGDPSLVKYGI
jgi:N-acyl homoserine lactone hydrolase